MYRRKSFLNVCDSLIFTLKAARLDTRVAVLDRLWNISSTSLIFFDGRAQTGKESGADLRCTKNTESTKVVLLQNIFTILPFHGFEISKAIHLRTSVATACPRQV